MFVEKYYHEEYIKETDGKYKRNRPFGKKIVLGGSFSKYTSERNGTRTVFVWLKRVYIGSLQWTLQWSLTICNIDKAWGCCWRYATHKYVDYHVSLSWYCTLLSKENRTDRFTGPENSPRCVAGIYKFMTRFVSEDVSTNNRDIKASDNCRMLWYERDGCGCTMTMVGDRALGHTHYYSITRKFQNLPFARSWSLFETVYSLYFNQLISFY